MLRATHLPAVCFDLCGLADSRGAVLVGRENDATIRMEVPELPMLMSRKHAELRRSLTDGRVHLVDLGSTNGTYTSQHGQPLRKIPPHVPWEVSDGTVIGFGGPECISIGSSSVRNPFLFRFYSSSSSEERGTAGQGHSARQQEDDLAQSDQMEAHSPYAAAGSKNAQAAGLQHNAGAQSTPGAFSTPHAVETSCSPPDAQAQAQDRLSCGSKASASALATHLSCHICQDWMVGCHTLSCGHMFCGHCLAAWLQTSNACPSCKRAVAGVPVRSFQVDSIVSDLLHHRVLLPRLPTAERQKRQARWESMQGDVAAAWARAVQERRLKAESKAARYHLAFMAKMPFPDS